MTALLRVGLHMPVVSFTTLSLSYPSCPMTLAPGGGGWRINAVDVGANSYGYKGQYESHTLAGR